MTTEAPRREQQARWTPYIRIVTPQGVIEKRRTNLPDWPDGKPRRTNPAE